MFLKLLPNELGLVAVGEFETFNNQITTNMTTENKTSQTTEPAIAVEPVLGTVFFKQITYKIEILKLSSPVPKEFHDDFIEWLKSKALEFGLGKQLEHYYDHDETGNSWIEVSFSVHCA